MTTELTLTQVRDRLAEMDGYVFHLNYALGHSVWVHASRPAKWISYHAHPIPETLDEASKLPDGWGFLVTKTNWWIDPSGRERPLNRDAYRAFAWPLRVRHDDPHGVMIVSPLCDTEIDARFRVQLAVREHIASTKETP